MSRYKRAVIFNNQLFFLIYIKVSQDYFCLATVKVPANDGKN